MSVHFSRIGGVPGAGFEPARPCEQWILSPPCLPFHHPGGSDEPNLGLMARKRLRRLLSLGAIVAAIAAFRSRRLASEEAKFDR